MKNDELLARIARLKLNTGLLCARLEELRAAKLLNIDNIVELAAAVAADVNSAEAALKSAA